MTILRLYSFLTAALCFVFDLILWVRIKKGRASAERAQEYKGIAGRSKPEGVLIWVHAASVGESQSALSLIDDMLARYPLAHVLVTTGTLTSAALMEAKLPDRAFHQFYPLDKRSWVQRFVAHWRPDFAVFMESEIWPNMMQVVAAQDVPMVMVNARMSVRSASRWQRAPVSIRTLLQPVQMIFAQTQEDADHYRALGALHVQVGGNIKYSAQPLPYDDADLTRLRAAIGDRPFWLYASTHAGEEELACQVHSYLKASFPNALSIIVPRHPERRTAVQRVCDEAGLQGDLRGENGRLPDSGTDIYIVDTLGELGLFYALSDVAVIGRSFSDDGGGGHNPIEAAQLGAAVLSGQHVRYQQDIFDDMVAHDAVIMVEGKADLAPLIKDLLDNPDRVQSLKDNGAAFVQSKDDILQQVEQGLWPLVDKTMGAEE